MCLCVAALQTQHHSCHLSMLRRQTGNEDELAEHVMDIKSCDVRPPLGGGLH